MKPRFIPSRRLLLTVSLACVAASVALFLGVSLRFVTLASTAFGALLLLLTVADLFLTRRAWRKSEVRMKRRLPSAFAIGVRQLVHLQFENTGTCAAIRGLRSL
jgi:hypothetical protein